ncbi:hypothetical protein V1511DRAFT_503831 [Dipodascopsis uninucleata]
MFAPLSALLCLAFTLAKRRSAFVLVNKASQPERNKTFSLPTPPFLILLVAGPSYKGHALLMLPSSCIARFDRASSSLVHMYARVIFLSLCITLGWARHATKSNKRVYTDVW